MTINQNKAKIPSLVFIDPGLLPLDKLLDPMICILMNKAKSFLGGGATWLFHPSFEAFHL